MATGADVRDILELTGGENDGPISKKDLINSDKVRDNHKIPTMMPVTVFRSYPCNLPKVTLAVGLRTMSFPQQEIEKSMLQFSFVNNQFLHHLSQKKTKKTTETLTFKRPEGMHREVYALLYSDKKYGFLLSLSKSLYWF